MTDIDPRMITDAEAPFLERLKDLGDLNELRRRAMDEDGQSRAMATGLAGYMLALKMGDRSAVPNPTTRTEYREILRRLLDNERPKGKRGRKIAAESGNAGLAQVVGIASGAAAGAVANAMAGPAVGVAVAVSAALNVTRIDGDDAPSNVVKLHPAPVVVAARAA